MMMIEMETLVQSRPFDQIRSERAQVGRVVAAFRTTVIHLSKLPPWGFLIAKLFT